MKDLQARLISASHSDEAVKASIGSRTTVQVRSGKTTGAT